MIGEDSHALTQVLRAAATGNRHAAADLLPMVYEELRRLAKSRMAHLAQGQTLQPTALVHEAYVRVMRSADAGWDGRGHFFGAAAQAMRDILVDQARRKASLKRGGDRQRVQPQELVLAIESPAEDLLALNEALEKFRKEDERKHQLVMLRFFAGLSTEESADILGISVATAERDWRYCRAWLHSELSGGQVSEGQGGSG